MRSASPEIAALTAKYLIVDSRPSQSAYALTDHLAHADPLVQRFEHWARARLADGFSLDEAARAVGASKRTLARRMQSVLGTSPLATCRVCASSAPCTCSRPAAPAWTTLRRRSGYADGVTLRALLRRRLQPGRQGDPARVVSYGAGLNGVGPGGAVRPAPAFFHAS